MKERKGIGGVCLTAGSLLVPPMRTVQFGLHVTNGWAQVMFSLSILLGFAVNHSTFQCTYYNDPLTTSVMGEPFSPPVCGVGHRQ